MRQRVPAAIQILLAPRQKAKQTLQIIGQNNILQLTMSIFEKKMKKMNMVGAKAA
jgi:hypothetical protein